jgi:two-component system LytT family response regulator
MNVIVVDDEASALATFLVMVVDDTRVNYKFFKKDPREALGYVRNNPVDGAFLDINMPLMNGLDLANELLKITPSIKIVFITGYVADTAALEKRYGDALLGFAYKPFDEEVLNRFIEKLYSFSSKPDIFFRLFGSFDLFLNGRPLDFYSSKSKELLALLVAYRGSELTMDDAICHLWPEKDIDLAKRLYRDAVWRLRKLLTENGLLYLVNFSRAKLALFPEFAHADFWDYLDKKNDDYKGEFLINYDWSLEYQYALGKH